MQFYLKYFKVLLLKEYEIVIFKSQGTYIYMR